MALQFLMDIQLGNYQKICHFKILKNPWKKDSHQHIIIYLIKRPRFWLLFIYFAAWNTCIVAVLLNKNLVLKPVLTDTHLLKQNMYGNSFNHWFYRTHWQ